MLRRGIRLSFTCANLQLLFFLAISPGTAVEISVAIDGQTSPQHTFSKKEELQAPAAANLVRREVQVGVRTSPQKQNASINDKAHVAILSRSEKTRAIAALQPSSVLGLSTLHASIDCVWSDWAEWTACSEECNMGYKMRARLIKRNHSGRGAQCQGPRQQSETCNGQGCDKRLHHLVEVQPHAAGSPHNDSMQASMATVSTVARRAKHDAAEVPEGVMPYLNFIYSFILLLQLGAGVFLLVKAIKAKAGEQEGPEENGALNNYNDPGEFYSEPADYGDGAFGEEDDANPFAPQKKKKGSGAGRKCKLCFGSFLIFTGVSGLLGIWLIGPMIAKIVIGKTEMTFDRLTLTKVLGPDSLMANAQITISKVSPIGGTLAKCDLPIMYKDKVFGQMAMPSLSVKAGQDNVIHLQGAVMTITDMDTWNDVMRAMIETETVEWRIAAEVSMSNTDFGLPVVLNGVPFDKSVNLKGLDGMKDLKVLALDMSKSTSEDIVIVLKVCLGNPSNIEILELGDLYFGIHYEGAFMGEATSLKTQVAIPVSGPSQGDCKRFSSWGYNLLEMSAKIKPADPTKCDDLISKYLGGHGFLATAKAMSPKAVSIPLFNGALQGFEMSVKVQGNVDSLLTGLEIHSMMLTPVDETTATGHISATASIESPLGAWSGLQAQEVDLTMNMSYGSKPIGVVTTGKTTIADAPLIKGSGSLTLSTSIVLTLHEQGAALALMAKDLIKAGSGVNQGIQLEVSGFADIVAAVEALHHPLSIKGVPVHFPAPPTGTHAALPPITVKGMNGLKGVKLLSYSIPGNVQPDGPFVGESTGIILEATASLNNPSTVGMYMDTLETNFKNTNGNILGSMIARRVNLVPGRNVLSLAGKLDPKGSRAITATEQFLTNFMKNKVQTVDVVGVDAGDGPSWLTTVANGLTLEASFPGVGDGFSALGNVRISAMFLNPIGFKVKLRLSFKMQMPPTVSTSIIMGVSGTSMTMIMNYNGDVARVEASPSDGTLTYNPSTASAQMVLHWVPLKILNMGKMTSMTTQMIFGGVNIKFTGQASPTIITNVGPLTLTDIPVSGTTRLEPCALFNACR